MTEIQQVTGNITIKSWIGEVVDPQVQEYLNRYPAIEYAILASQNAGYRAFNWDCEITALGRLLDFCSGKLPGRSEMDFIGMSSMVHFLDQCHTAPNIEELEFLHSLIQREAFSSLRIACSEFNVSYAMSWHQSATIRDEIRFIGRPNFTFPIDVIWQRFDRVTEIAQQIFQITEHTTPQQMRDLIRKCFAHV